MSNLIPPHGGYGHLKTFQLAELIYDITVRFCDAYIDRHSRTHDQMVQAARSGTRNISEGSVDSAISKKSELKLTGIAKGSLDELRLDFEAFLRQRRLTKWAPNHPSLLRFKRRRCATVLDFRRWVAKELTQTDTDRHRPTETDNRVAEVAANGALSLLNICLYLLDRQLEALAAAFEKEGGFTERLYRVRREKRDKD